ncbi:alginate lyase family protein [Hufsiella ginkgonis]|uniref:Alginate lyase domain-containing protein n=1 Tax=Hufsiella ginkgonis TaxID=2695274 RepID=A0A7K1XZF6_9SPHI|nr:alginate lyase family protein [Hufsiella ginkgonis]MXV16391.1 hypothetical protein [Hufsiella ginkgonis]
MKLKNPLLALFILLYGYFSAAAQEQVFVHPGLLHAKEDLERMRNAVAEKEEPVFSGFMVFKQNAVSQFTYQLKGPLPVVGRNPTVGQGDYDADANAAHQNALMWAITGDKRYAAKAIEILDAWSSVLKSVTGRDAVLMAGLGPFKMVNAAELIRYTNAGWSQAGILQAEKHFKEVIYPVVKDFAPFANGNWDAAAIKTVMSIGVFCNDRALFERALRYYVNGWGNGMLTNYVINEAGQVQESGRDQAHTQLGIALLGDCSEIAWHQGLDLYAYAGNRLLKGFEYTARYNLGNEVPFEHTLDRTGKYEHFKPSTQARGNLRAVYEQIYNHYVRRKGMAAPFTGQAAAKLRPEGPGNPGADHPGYGTLFYSRPAEHSADKPVLTPAAPGALFAEGSAEHVKLSWVASIGATSYTIKRAVKAAGPFTVIAKNIAGEGYTDKQVKSSTTYYYRVSASADGRNSADSYPAGASAGLPSPWKTAPVGAGLFAGTAQYDGAVFSLSGWGAGADSLKDAFQFTWFDLAGDGSLTVRYVPQLSSQFTRFGIMMRESLHDNAPQASLWVYPGKTDQLEAPAWHTRLLSREATGGVAKIIGQTGPLSAPAVTYGRLTGYYWLRLVRKGALITAFISYNGTKWREAGRFTTHLSGSLLAGPAIASGMKNSTTVRFDQVTIEK